jgi:hypothetical protein
MTLTEYIIVHLSQEFTPVSARKYQRKAVSIESVPDHHETRVRSHFYTVRFQ